MKRAQRQGAGRGERGGGLSPHPLDLDDRNEVNIQKLNFQTQVFYIRQMKTISLVADFLILQTHLSLAPCDDQVSDSNSLF